MILWRKHGSETTSGLAGGAQSNPMTTVTARSSFGDVDLMREEAGQKTRLPGRARTDLKEGPPTNYLLATLTTTRETER